MNKPYNRGSNGDHCKVSYRDNFKIGKGSTYNYYFWYNARYGVCIGENTLIGPFVIIHSVNHVIKNIEIEQNANDENSWCKNDRSKRITRERIKIGNDVWIGARVIILAGSIIPDKCIIDAGTIITKSNCKSIEIGDIVVSENKLRILKNRKDIETKKE